MPFGIRATSNRYGIEGFHLKDVLGVFALARPSSLTTRQLFVDVETRGEIDPRHERRRLPGRMQPTSRTSIWESAWMSSAVREYIDETLGRAL